MTSKQIAGTAIICTFILGIFIMYGMVIQKQYDKASEQETQQEREITEKTDSVSNSQGDSDPFRSAFIEGCQEESVSPSFCGCAHDYLDRNDRIGDLVEVVQRPESEQAKQIGIELARECGDEL